MDDKFAGKKGQCKQCGAIMPIPAAARPGPSAVVARSRPRGGPRHASRPAERPTSTDSRTSPCRPGRPRDGPRGGRGGPALATRPKKKKAVGFFAGSAKSKGAGRPTSGGTIVVRIVLGIVGGIVGILFTNSDFRPALPGLGDERRHRQLHQAAG